MSTLSHNFYGINKINNFGEVDPLPAARFDTAVSTGTGTNNSVNIPLTRVVYDPFRMAVRDQNGIVAIAISETGMWNVDIGVDITTAGTNVQFILTLKKQGVAAFSGSNYVATGGISLRDLNFFTGAAGRYSLAMDSLQFPLKKGDVISIEVSTASAGGTVQPVGSYLAARLVSKDQPVI